MKCIVNFKENDNKLKRYWKIQFFRLITNRICFDQVSSD